jgi:formylglycine-generating enzyme
VNRGDDARTAPLRLALTGGVVLALSAAAVGVRAWRAPAPVPSARRAPPRLRAVPAVVPAPAPEPAPSVAPAPPPPDGPPPKTLDEQRRALFSALRTELDFSPAQVEAVQAIVEGSPFIGQGNPAVSHHAMTPAQCRAIRAAALGEPPWGAPSSHPPCDRKNMAPLYDPGAGETAALAKVCIDQFEFPDIACEYPVVYPTAREAALLCAAVGKRICDAHEWEGACAGALHPPEAEYFFGEPRPYATWLHNEHREIRWAYGPAKNHALCATAALKSEACSGGGFATCGTQSWPAGAFPACVSPFGVYDLHGNVAEHMNLPLAPAQLASRGGTGATEMKGSWFIFLRAEAYEDDCRWRAKNWHPSDLMAEDSHRNYHLGFRCCADVPATK